MEIDDQVRVMLRAALELQLSGDDTARVARAMTILLGAAIGAAKMGGLAREQFFSTAPDLWGAVHVTGDGACLN